MSNCKKGVVERTESIGQTSGQLPIDRDAKIGFSDG